MSARSTKKTKTDEVRREYRRQDLGNGARGKYLALAREGSNLVLLEPDVAEVFETPKAVNDALRSLIAVANRSTRRVVRGKPRKSPAR
jgi:hypothetical protein